MLFMVLSLGSQPLGSAHSFPRKNFLGKFEGAVFLVSPVVTVIATPAPMGYGHFSKAKGEEKQCMQKIQ
jgi:hypothetical protein